MFYWHLGTFPFVILSYAREYFIPLSLNIRLLVPCTHLTEGSVQSLREASQRSVLGTRPSIKG